MGETRAGRAMLAGISADALGGLAMAALGVATVVLSTRYRFGTPAQMGPGFLPTLLGVMLILFGTAIAIVHRTAEEGGTGPVNLRPLIFVLAATIAFALLLERAGLFVSSVVLVLVACGAERGYRLARSLALAVALASIVSVVFVYLLRIPMRVWFL